jgi:predicted esterase
MKLQLYFLYFCLIMLSLRLEANSDTRRWTLDPDEQFTAELVAYDEATGKVHLKFHDTEDKYYDFDRFSAVDRAWLLEYVEIGRELDALIDDLGGKVEHIVTQGEYPTELFVYYPSSKQFSTAPLPGMILFSPGGKGARFLKSHVEAAEATNFVMISCDTFRNNRDKALSDLFLLRFQEILPQIIARTQIDPQKVYMGGTSGGAARAYSYSAKVVYPWAGIYANGGWLGGKENYGRPYASGMRIAMVNGNQDRGANHYVDPDSEVLVGRGSKVALFSFEGAHQIPPANTMGKAFNWLLEQEDFLEE